MSSLNAPFLSGASGIPVWLLDPGVQMQGEIVFHVVEVTF